MLIGVTAFFRDPTVWQELKETVLPALLSRASENTRLRAWVVGCSTGEEAYSLAMVFKEVAEAIPEPGQHTLQIFATDLSADAIAVARRGQYSAKVADDMAPERLARFFDANTNGFKPRTRLQPRRADGRTRTAQGMALFVPAFDRVMRVRGREGWLTSYIGPHKLA
jgi:chemotaxis methyl-accepting protein methylase